MGTTVSTVNTLDVRLAKLRDSFKEASASERSDPEFIKHYQEKVGEIDKELNEAIKKKEVKPGEHSVSDLKKKMEALSKELSETFVKAQEKRYATAVAEMADKFFPKVVEGIERYQGVARAARRDVKIDLQTLVGHMTGKPNATKRWNEFADREQKEILEIEPKGDKRDAVIVEWNQLQAIIAGENKAIQEVKRQEKEEKTAAFQDYLTKAEKALSGSWGESDGTASLRKAMTAFRQDVANAGWNITEHTTEAFYDAAGQFGPADILLTQKERDTTAADHYDITGLQDICHGTSHAERIKRYIKDKVAPKAHRAGLNAKNNAVIMLVRMVATEWCSAAESSNTGGNAAMVANFSRGDMISTVKDLPDESKTAILSLDTRIAVIQSQLDKEIRPEQIEHLKRTLTSLQQQKENT